MNDGHGKRRLLPNLLLAAMLLAAQFGMAMHSAGHETGVPQTTVCKTCIGFDQLAAASVDQNTATELDVSGPYLTVFPAADFRSAHALSVRQRGPPVSA